MSSKTSKALLSSVELIVFDFDGVFTDNTVYVNQDGQESVRCWRSDGLGLSRLSSLGVKLFIVSTETNPVVSIRAKKLNIPCIQGVEDKAKIIQEICMKHDVSLKKSVFVGNDINDIAAFKIVGVPISVADAYPEVNPHVVYQTIKPGGYGAVREICDLIYNAKVIS